MLLAHLREPYHLMALLMYGAGLRLRGVHSPADRMAEPLDDEARR